MIDLVNALVLAVCSFVAGMAVHSLWLHAKKRKELNEVLKVEHK